MNYYECPTCHQDMRAKPHEGMRGENCPQCGQGMFWRVARIHQRVNKASSGLVDWHTAKPAKVTKSNKSKPVVSR